jgi:hypothetical protein
LLKFKLGCEAFFLSCGQRRLLPKRAQQLCPKRRISTLDLIL